MSNLCTTSHFVYQIWYPFRSQPSSIISTVKVIYRRLGKSVWHLRNEPVDELTSLVGQNGSLGVGLLIGVALYEAPSIKDRNTLDKYLEGVTSGWYWIFPLDWFAFSWLAGGGAIKYSILAVSSSAKIGFHECRRSKIPVQGHCGKVRGIYIM